MPVPSDLNSYLWFWISHRLRNRLSVYTPWSCFGALTAPFLPAGIPPASPKGGKGLGGGFFGGQAGKKFMGSVMDTLMFKNLPTFKGKVRASEPFLTSPQVRT